MTRKKTLKAFEPGHGFSKQDWDEVSDTPELTAADVAQARPFAEAFPDLMDSIKRARGRPKVASPKEAVTLRLAPETIARFKSQGGKDWRAKMSEALDKASGR
ncbi:BrnA antitoxin family protein [Xanthobacter variabilis]|uniref:BrnA antitoxin family protein n=1 Tax=Xanthobacter variabilis TaxID=3119932 RepID=UPI0037268629